MHLLSAISGSYCGSPPPPAELWRYWNLDPVLIFLALLAGAAYFFGPRRASLRAGDTAVFCAGVLVLCLALVSPLCSLSVALFSARVAQHMVITLIAAPLIVLGVGNPAFAAPSAVRWWSGPMPAAALYAALVWFWHTPAPYAATFDNKAVYWLMHISLIFAALVLWRALLRPE